MSHHTFRIKTARKFVWPYLVSVQDLLDGDLLAAVDAAGQKLERVDHLRICNYNLFHFHRFHHQSCLRADFRVKT